MFGGIIDPEVLREIDATNPTTWMRKRPERVGLDPKEENFPVAWAAGRELAKGAYARRLRDAQPIPRDKEGMKVAMSEGVHLMNEVADTVNWKEAFDRADGFDRRRRVGELSSAELMHEYEWLASMIERIEVRKASRRGARDRLGGLIHEYTLVAA